MTQLIDRWIPCDADNPPPAEIPDWMWMAVWSTDERRIKPGPIFVYGEWQKQGRPGKDFTHYLLIPKPEGANDTQGATL